MSIQALKKLSIFIILVNLFYGAIAIVQVLTIKNVVFMSIYIKFLLLAFIYIWILYLLSHKKIILLIPKNVALPYLIWIAYSIISFLLLFRFNYPSIYILFSYIATMFYPAFMLIYTIGSKKICINEDQRNNLYKYFTKFLYICAALIWPLGIIQYILNNPIITINIQDNYWTFMSQNFIGKHIRATSFFSSGLDFGLFSLLIMTISLSKILFSNNRKNIDVIFFLLSIFCIFISLTRNVYIVSLFTLITVILFYLHKLHYKYFYKYLPLIYLSLIVIALIFINPILHILKSSFLFNSSSTLMRFKEWSDFFSKYILNGNITNVLFGYGLIQNSRFDLTKNIIIDNIYLSFILYEGLFGLIFYLISYFSIYKYLLKCALKNKNYFEISIISIMSSYLIRGFFNITVFGDYMNFILIFLILLINKNISFNNKTKVEVLS